MSQGIIALFDPISSGIISKIFADYAKKALNCFMQDHQVSAHLTILAGEIMDESTASQTIRNISTIHHSFLIEVGSIGYFPSSQVLFLNPKESESLRDLHQDILIQIADLDNSFQLIQNELWIPHITLARGLSYENVGQAMQITQEHINLQEQNPFHLWVESVAYFQYPPFRILSKAELIKRI